MDSVRASTAIPLKMRALRAREKLTANNSLNNSQLKSASIQAQDDSVNSCYERN